MAKKIICHVPPRIFLVYKPRGLHSGDVLKHFKYHLPKGFGKIGHLGTLDPFAEGLLLIAIGQAARLSFLFEDLLTKTYLARGVFNFKSTTGDSDGVITQINAVNQLITAEFLEKSSQLIGEYYQSPPHFSAAKHEGRALYEYARAGILIDKPPVKRVIYRLKDFEFIKNEKCSFTAEVSSGTYIRTLFEDMAKNCNSMGYLEFLKRLKIGAVSCDESLHQDLWPKRDEAFDIIGNSVCPSYFFDFPKIIASPNLLKRIENGQRILAEDADIRNIENGTYFWAYSEESQIRGLLYLEEGVLSPRVIFPKINQNN